jgi:hypothetical protein
LPRTALVLALFAAAAIPAAPAPAAPPAPGGPSAPSAPPAGAGALFGAHLQPPSRDVEAQKQDALRLEASLGRALDIDHNFYPWDVEFPTWREAWDLENGRIPMISWNGDLTLGIAAGAQDGLIAQRADAVRALGRPVFIRWMWEMDGARKQDDSLVPQSYVLAWRHIHDVFQSRGATNVEWVWCPNAFAFEAGADGPSYYPGDGYVDWICADGYNWNPGRVKAPWRSFSDIYSAFYTWGRAQGKPMMVGEFGVQERGPGEKAAWLADARQAVKTRFPAIGAVVYFDAEALYDWRVDTSDSALAAFRDWARDPYFNPRRRPVAP